MASQICINALNPNLFINMHEMRVGCSPPNITNEPCPKAHLENTSNNKMYDKKKHTFRSFTDTRTHSHSLAHTRKQAERQQQQHRAHH